MRTRLLHLTMLAMLALSLVGGPRLASASTGAPSSSNEQLVSALGKARIAYHSKTGKVSFIGTGPGDHISRANGISASASPEAKARGFLARYGQLFGIRDQARDLRVEQSRPAGQGRSIVRFQQVEQGVPVLAGELNVQLDASGNVISANGEASPDLAISVTPTVSPEQARRTARDLVAKLHRLEPGQVAVSQPRLWIYDSRLLSGPGSGVPTLVWRMDATSPQRMDLDELVLVDARRGLVTLHFNQAEPALYRAICNANNTGSKVPCTSPYARVEGQPATGNVDVDDAYKFAGVVYNFYKTTFGRDSIDGRGMKLYSTVKYCEQGQPCPLVNAFWNGKQMVYGTGFASADDVVGHEMTHGVTSRESNLFYWFQTGAINESMSDIFGELIDLTDRVGNDSASVRWELGEDLPSSQIECLPDGAVRDMKNPPMCGQPDKMTSSMYYSGLQDNGGVHTNSGVGNKAAYLMTDGGSFNGRTVRGLGVNKVAHIYYEVNTNILTSGSDYQDLYDGLFQACQDLIGSYGITSSDCTQVRNATLAVQMNQQPTTGAAVPEAPVCPVGQVPTDLFYDNMENSGDRNWTKQTQVGTNAWGYDTTGDYATSGRSILYGQDLATKSDSSMAMSRAVSVPTGKTTYVRFSQAVNFEAGYDSNFNYVEADGGVVEYSTDGGTTWKDAGPLFVNNGYYGQITDEFDNPLGGRRAFVDTTGGYFSSRLNVSSLAGKSLKLRFRIGTDTGGTGYFGWTVDDVRVYTCTNGTRPAGSIANMLRNPGFEWDDNDDGRPDFWSQDNSALRWRDLKHGGSYSVRLKAADYQPYRLFQVVHGITAGHAYDFSGYVDIPAQTGVNAKVQVQWLNSSNRVIGTRVIKSYSNTNTGGAWQHVYLNNFAAPTGATGARVMVWVGSIGSTIYVDDFLFKP